MYRSHSFVLLKLAFESDIPPVADAGKSSRHSRRVGLSMFSWLINRSRRDVSGVYSSTVYEVIRFLRRFCATNYGVRKHFGGIGLCHDSDTPRNTPTIDWLPLDIGGRQRTRNALDCAIHCTCSGSLRKS